MNAKTLIASIVVALGAAPAFASDATQFATEASTASRAEVQAELTRAVTAGELNVPGEAYGTVAVGSASSRQQGLTRAAVIAELQRARADGELRIAGESYGSFRPSELVSTRTRAEVRAQVRSGGLSRGNYRDYTGG